MLKRKFKVYWWYENDVLDDVYETIIEAETIDEVEHIANTKFGEGNWNLAKD